MPQILSVNGDIEIPKPTSFTTMSTACCLHSNKFHILRLKPAIFGSGTFEELVQWGKFLEEQEQRGKLGDGFKHFFIFTPKIGEMIQFDGCIFFKWVGSTTTRKGLLLQVLRLEAFLDLSFLIIGWLLSCRISEVSKAFVCWRYRWVCCCNIAVVTLADVWVYTPPKN